MSFYVSVETSLVLERPIASDHMTLVRSLSVTDHNVLVQISGAVERFLTASLSTDEPGHVLLDVHSDLGLPQEPFAAVFALELFGVVVGHVLMVKRPVELVGQPRARRDQALETFVFQRVYLQLVGTVKLAAARIAPMHPELPLHVDIALVPAQAPGGAEQPLTMVARQRVAQTRLVPVSLGHVPLQMLPPVVSAIALVALECLQAPVPLNVNLQTVWTAERGRTVFERARVFRHDGVRPIVLFF